MLAASALLAFQRGNDADPDLEYVGALMVAEHYADLAIIRMAITGQKD